MPTTELDLKIACPKCGKGYRWKATLAGRKVQCKKCSTSFRMPADPPLHDDAVKSPPAATESKKKAAPNLAGGDGNGALLAAGSEANPYDIHDPEEQPKEQAKVPCRDCEQMIAKTAIICVHCGINQRTGLPMDGRDGKKNRKKKTPKAGGIAKLGPLLKLGAALVALAGAAACYFMFMK